MPKGRKSEPTNDVRRARRKKERLCLRKPTDPAVEELAWLARIPQENPDPVFRVSAQHVLLYSNPAGEELCRAWGCGLGQKVPAAIQTIVSTALADGAVARHKVAFGSRIYGLTVAPAAPDGYVTLYARDITDYKRAQEALRQAEQRFRTIFDTTSDGIFLHDLESGKLTMCNKSFLQMLGYTEEESAQLGVADLHPEADLSFIYAQIDKFLQGGKPVRHDIRFQRKDGSVLFADVSPDLVLLDGRQYAVVALKDVTERKRAEEALQRERDQAQQYLRMAGVMIMALDRDGRITLINEKGCEILGYRREEIVGRDWFDICLPPEIREEVTGIFHQLLAGNIAPVEHYANTVLRKDGQQRIVAFHNTVLRDPSSRVVGILCSGEDITERKQMEEEIRQHTEHLEELVEARTREVQESERRYRSLAENAPDVIQRFDRELRHLYVNPAFEQATGLPPPAVIGRTDRELQLPEDLIPFWEQAAQTVFQTGEDQIIEFEMPTPQGPRHYEAHLVPEFTPDGATEHVLAITRDITERTRMEGTLQFTQFAVDHTADAAFWMTEDGRFFYVNGAACRALDYSREELLQMTVYDIDPAFTEYMWRESWRKLKAEKSIVLETVHRARDGRTYPVEIRANYLEFGGREYDCAFARDITERKRAEEALRESEARFRTAFEEGAVAMTLTALDSTLLKVNSSFCRMLGFSEAELVGRSYTEITHPDDRAANLAGTWGLACGEIASFRMEKRYIRKDGSIIWADMSTASVRDEQGRPLYCVTHVQDITERRQAEEALRRLNERLELQVAQRTDELRRTVDRLQQLTLELSQAEDRERRRIADILHDDVQQTLAAAKFHLSLLGSEPRSAEESQEIVGQVKHMLKDAIEKSRRLSHELSPALYQVDLTAILEWLARHMQQKHGLTVHVEARGPLDSPPEPLKAFLYKVAQELLFNVIKHAGVREARIRVRQLGSRLYLSVADRGRGFDPRRLERARGFGLLGIRERVQLLGGRMKIKSAPGTGSTLLIAVPYEGPSRAAGPAGHGDGQVQSEAPT